MTRILNTELELDGADQETAAEIAQSVRRFHADFPHAARMLHRVAMTDFENHGEDVDPENDLAFTGRIDQLALPPCVPVHPGTGLKIEVNRNFYGQGCRQKFVDASLESYHDGNHPYFEPSWAFDHELGHILDIHTACADVMFVPYSFLHVTEQDAISVSKYGVCGGPPEAFAEAFTTWWNGSPVGNHRIRHTLHTVCAIGRGQLAAA